MLTPNENGTYTLDTYDVIGVMKDVSTGRFHACVWLESPPPSASKEDLYVRLKSKMHHTAGADTFEGAVAHVNELRAKLVVDDSNVWVAKEQMVERDFAKEGYAEVVIVSKWR